MTGRVWRAATDESAATAVEYAVMVALVSVVIIGGVTAQGNSVNGVFAGVELESTAEDAVVPGIEVADAGTTPADPTDDGEGDGEGSEDTTADAGNSGNPHPQGGPPAGAGGGPPVTPPGGGRGGRP